MDDTFESRSEALRAAARNIQVSDDISQTVLSDFLRKAEVVKRIQPSSAPRSDVQPLLVGSYVIRHDVLLSADHFLTLLKSALKVAVGIAGIKSLAGGAAIADGIYGLYKFYIEVEAKGFHLSEFDLAVVSVLRELQIASATEVASRLSIESSSQRAEAILASFQKSDLNPFGFTIRNENGMWSLVGV